jgi:hypothetical protein
MCSLAEWHVLESCRHYNMAQELIPGQRLLPNLAAEACTETDQKSQTPCESAYRWKEDRQVDPKLGKLAMPCNTVPTFVAFPDVHCEPFLIWI